MRRESIHRSLTNKLLIFGVEKSYLLITIVITSIPLIIDVQLINIAASICLFIVFILIGNLLAANDPYMFAIIIRHMKHQEFYDGQEYYGYKKRFKYKNQETMFGLPK